MASKIFRNPYHNATLVHNEIFDRIMPSLSSDGWKVLCVALRQTWGWGRNATRLDEPLFRRGTGIEDKAALARALQECVDAGYLIRRRIGQSTLYTLNADFELEEGRGMHRAEPQPQPTPTRPAPAGRPLSDHERAVQALRDFAREMGVTPDTERLEAAATASGAQATEAWVRLGRAMTNLEEAARFQTVLDRLLARVPPLPPSMMNAATEMPQPAAPPPTPTPQSAEELWKRVLKALRPKMRSSKYRFLKPTRGIALTENTLTVAAPNERTREWLETGQLAGVIKETFAEITGGRLKLEFVVGK